MHLMTYKSRHLQSIAVYYARLLVTSIYYHIFEGAVIFTLGVSH